MKSSVKPNVLVFFTDQQRWDTCGCYGANPMDLTPCLDEMASRGALARYSFTCQPVCAPARACLQTGTYATQNGVVHNGCGLRAGQRTLAHAFRDAGYFTGYIGKWHLALTGEKPVPVDRRGGYDDYWTAADILEFVSQPYDLRMFDADCQQVHRPGYRVDAQTDLLLELLEDRSKDPDQPFFVVCSYLEPHHQNDAGHFVGPNGSADRFQSPYVPGDLSALTGDWAGELPDYYGACASLDENLGRVLGFLEDRGLDERTVVLFCSDHGSHFRTRNGEYKRSCHESSIRVPTVIQGPGFDGGGVIEELVSLVDWSATLLDCAGIPIPVEMMGHSLLTLLDGRAKEWPREVFVQISESQIGRAIRSHRWKYGVNAPGKDGWAEPGSDMYLEQYIYDLENDPHELENLAGQQAIRRVADELSDTLKRRMVAAGERRPEIRPAVSA